MGQVFHRLFLQQGDSFSQLCAGRFRMSSHLVAQQLYETGISNLASPGRKLSFGQGVTCQGSPVGRQQTHLAGYLGPTVNLLPCVSALCDSEIEV